jgi:hypothetical protein
MKTPTSGARQREWVNLTAVVTGISIYAFATSNFYVWGLADVLKKPLAVYFSPTDYLRITPGWTVPTLSITGFAIIAYLSGMVAALSQRRSTTSKPSKRPILALALVLGILGTFTMLLFNSKWRGEQYARSGIPEAPSTQVLFESEKDKVASLEGKLIFDLDRYLLLYTEIDSLHPQISGRIVAIPHEKIKWIQTPPVESPIAAETSHRPPETIRRRVLPSPVESPAPAETSPRLPVTIQHNILPSPVESPAPAETSPRPPVTTHHNILPSPVEAPAPAETSPRPPVTSHHKVLASPVESPGATAEPQKK